RGAAAARCGRARRTRPSAVSAARGRGGRPRPRTHRSAAAAGPSPTSRTCACPSASLPPGSAARPRGCRRSPSSRGYSSERLRALRGGRRGRLVESRALDLADLVRLDQVAFLDVVVALEVDAALEALGDLADVVLEALERVDRGLVDDCAVADDAGPRAAAD